MAKCKWCGHEVPTLKTLEVEVICRVDGQKKSDEQRFIAICDECIKDTVYHMNDVLEAAKA